MALRGIQDYIARDVNNIARVETRVILLASRAIYSCIPRKRAIQYYYYSYRALCVIVGDCRLPFCHRTKAKACRT